MCGLSSAPLPPWSLSCIFPGDPLVPCPWPERPLPPPHTLGVAAMVYRLNQARVAAPELRAANAVARHLPSLHPASRDPPLLSLTCPDHFYRYKEPLDLSSAHVGLAHSADAAAAPCRRPR